MKRLEGMVAVVTGASRGGGRGIALVLGEEGAVVYVTGRSSRSAQTGSTRPDLPGTCIEDTAEMVTARGGVGIPVQCDHTDDSDVERLFDRVRQEHGKLDLLVNNVWGGYEKDPQRDFDSPFWEQPTWRWDAMFTSGVRAHYVASQHAARMMVPKRRGLIISTTFWDRGKYFTPLPYYLSKLAINRMMYAMSLELREYGVSTVALSPGWMRTEAVMADIPPNTAESRGVRQDRIRGVHRQSSRRAVSRSPSVGEVGHSLPGRRPSKGIWLHRRRRPPGAAIHDTGRIPARLTRFRRRSPPSRPAGTSRSRRQWRRGRSRNT